MIQTSHLRPILLQSLALASVLVLAPAVSAQQDYNRSSRSRVFSNTQSGTGQTAAATGTPASQPVAQTAAPQGQNTQALRTRQRGVGPGGTVQGQPGQGRRGQQPAAAPGVPGVPGRGGAPGGQPTQIGGAGGGSRGGNSGASSFTMTGKIAEIGKAFAESIRTRRVDFDSTKASKQPNIIILGRRKYKADPGTVPADSALARPL